MDDYTPTTEEVRDAWVSNTTESYVLSGPTRWAFAEARFDRWLASVRADAWDEGFKQGGPMHDVNYDDPDAHTRNPYRENEGKRAHQAFKENPTAGPDEILAILDRESEGK
jgi:hypothetical protein